MAVLSLVTFPFPSNFSLSSSFPLLSLLLPFRFPCFLCNPTTPILPHPSLSYNLSLSQFLFPFLLPSPHLSPLSLFPSIISPLIHVHLFFLIHHLFLITFPSLIFSSVSSSPLLFSFSYKIYPVTSSSCCPVILLLFTALPSSLSLSNPLLCPSSLFLPFLVLHSLHPFFFNPLLSSCLCLFYC